MLTKYLSESGEEAAITATICIDSLFDLDEVTKSYPHCVALDQKLAHGFVDILQANKVTYFNCVDYIQVYFVKQQALFILKKLFFLWWKNYTSQYVFYFRQ